MTIQPFELENGQTIYVDIEETEQDIPLPQSKNLPSDLPPNATPTGIIDDTIIGGKLLKETISNTAESVYDSLKDLNPDEWSVEINVGFKGKATIIPILVSGEGNGSIKVTATWKKEIS